MQKLFLKKLFKRSDDCDVAPGKYYFYVKGHALESNICGYISNGNDFFYSNTFYGLIKKLFQNPYNLNLGTWDYFYYVYESLKLDPKQLKKFKSTKYLFNHVLNCDTEKWAQLLTIDLYNVDVISPFIYKKFIVNGMSFGLEDFYFRGYNNDTLLNSFYYHIKKISYYMPGYNMAVRRKSKRDFLNHFYNICIDIFGMNLNPTEFDKEKFLSNENLFIKETTQFEVFQNSRYYKRRVLIA